MATSYIVTNTNNLNGPIQSTVILRIDVPAGTNSVGTSWQTAAAQYRQTQNLVGTTRWPGASSTALDDGTEYETWFNYRDNPNNPGIITRLETKIALVAAEQQTAMQNQLQYWGKTGVI